MSRRTSDSHRHPPTPPAPYTLIHPHPSSPRPHPPLDLFSTIFGRANVVRPVSRLSLPPATPRCDLKYAESVFLARDGCSRSTHANNIKCVRNAHSVGGVNREMCAL
ncbi:unnamed protein product [Danaus chrysippus]|uniref:(African queen) hypothetical protein n=1 Tax=Danaus chrysippus TaxID=151541 RepID=A0A8J2QS43_9NEOP|nr:unnamed protein product [Danaus chrysippus]